MLGIVRRRRPATGGVLPGRRQTEPAGERLLPALQTGIQPELPGRRVPLPVPVERRGLADGKLSEALRIKKKKKKKSNVTKKFFPPLCVSLKPGEMNLLCHVWWRVAASVGGQRGGGEELLMKIRWSDLFFFFPQQSLAVKWITPALTLIGQFVLEKLNSQRAPVRHGCWLYKEQRASYMLLLIKVDQGLLERDTVFSAQVRNVSSVSVSLSNLYSSQKPHL